MSRQDQDRLQELARPDGSDCCPAPPPPAAAGGPGARQPPACTRESCLHTGRATLSFLFSTPPWLQGVKSIKELKDLKAVKSVTRIDDDLAMKMRDLIENQKTERGSEQVTITTTTVQPKIQEPDLENKVQRILEMFNVKDLDEILNAIPITSIKKLPTRESHSEGTCT